MTSDFKILVDRLKGGQVEKIQGFFDPVFLGIEEKELVFSSPVEVKGEAYLSEEHLVLHLSGATEAKMPCAICNQMIAVPLKVTNFYHTEPIESIVGAIFDFSEPLREALLIELPKVVECQGGQCPERTALKPYMRSKKRSNNTTYYPFSDLN